MRRGSLRSGIILSVNGLLVALIAATLVIVGYQADRFVTGQEVRNQFDWNGKICQLMVATVPLPYS